MTKPKITLFIDIVSPFNYLAFYALRNFPVFQQCEITYVPIFLGGIMKKADNRPPILIKNKDKWINIERLRWARQFDIPMCEVVPEGFPPNTLPTQRALTALTMDNKRAEKLPDVVSALYHAFWVDKQPISKPEVVVPVFAKALNISESDAKELFAKGASAEAKELLLKNTDMAFDDGAFGMPWFIATNSKGKKESFWGFDHLGQVMDHLGLHRPSDNRGWRSML